VGVTFTNHFIRLVLRQGGKDSTQPPNGPERMVTSRRLTGTSSPLWPIVRAFDGTGPAMLQQGDRVVKRTPMTNNTKAMDCVVGPKDTSYEPSAEGKQGRGQTTRHDIGKGWGDTTRREQRHVLCHGCDQKPLQRGLHLFHLIYNVMLVICRLLNSRVPLPQGFSQSCEEVLIC